MSVRPAGSDPGEEKRYLMPEVREKRSAERAFREFRLEFFRKLDPTHPLYKSSEAREPE